MNIKIIETFTKESIEDASIIFKSINIEEPKNEHFTKDCRDEA